MQKVSEPKKFVGVLWYPDPSFNKTIDSIITEHRNCLKVHKLVVNKKVRCRGIGTIFMIALCHYAEKKGKKIYLTPSTAFGGSSVQRLTKFYRAFGFVKNSVHNSISDPTYDNMVRMPKGD